MADFTASVITLANAALVAIEKTVRYIKEIIVINTLIKDLLLKLKDLHRLVRTVASTCKAAGAGHDTTSSRFVGKTLSTCQDRLEILKPLVFELASLESNTWMQKIAVKRQSDKVKKDIESNIRNIHCDMKYINTGLHCWNLEEQRAIRRISEAMAERQALDIRVGLQAESPIVPVRRTMSDAETVFGHDPELRRVSTTSSTFSHPSIASSTSSNLPSNPPSPSMPSFISQTSTPSLSSGALPQMIPSTLSHSPPISPYRSSSTFSPPAASGMLSNHSYYSKNHLDWGSVGPDVAMTPAPQVASKVDWEEFHFHVAKCGGDDHRAQQIREILQKHIDASTLTRSTDNWDRTPLHVAAERGDVELAQILYEFGADINAKDSEPSSVLDFAVASKHRNFVAFLLRHGVDESNILARNSAKFKEMKRTILFEQKAAQKKGRSLSRSAPSGIII